MSNNHNLEDRVEKNLDLITLETISAINKDESIESMVSTALSYMHDYFGSICSISWDFDENEEKFKYEKHKERLPEEFRELALELAIESYKRDTTFSGNSMNDMERSYLLIPIQKKIKGNIEKYGVLQLVRSSDDQFTDKERDSIFKIAQSLGTSFGCFYGQEEKEKANTDYLTQAHNRLKIDESLESEIKRSRRYDRALSIMMFDIDHFKTFNDTYGHQQGDLVLQELVEVTKDSIRSVDYIGRYGGEEFLVILPELDEAKAISTAEKIRKNIEEKQFTNRKDRYDPLNVTVSIGVQQYDSQMTTEQLISLADQHLYRAKEQGRNKVIGSNDYDNMNNPQ